jgi:hypothetical protein
MGLVLARSREILTASSLAPRGLSAFVIVSRCRLDGQLLQPSGQQLELLVCAEFVQPVNANLNRLGVLVGDIIDVFGVTHSSSPSITVPVASCSNSDGDRVGPHRDEDEAGSEKGPRRKRDQGPEQHVFAEGPLPNKAIGNAGDGSIALPEKRAPGIPPK